MIQRKWKIIGSVLIALFVGGVFVAENYKKETQTLLKQGTEMFWWSVGEVQKLPENFSNDQDEIALKKEYEALLAEIKEEKDIRVPHIRAAFDFLIEKDESYSKVIASDYQGFIQSAKYYRSFVKESVLPHKKTDSSCVKALKQEVIWARGVKLRIKMRRLYGQLHHALCIMHRDKKIFPTEYCSSLKEEAVSYSQMLLLPKEGGKSVLDKAEMDLSFWAKEVDEKCVKQPKPEKGEG
ncbi:MAG: hypothetical protein OXR68_01090 [Alphaproteobacteria bacterium]|nr:hypothetical protein [Alphaproteobacteria bacterium]MDD9919206.1 hypothetical protein [Alphaproteobacteria bacterium]